MDKTILKNKADQNPLTWNPSTSLDANKMSTALITNKNKPSVNMVAGIDKNTKTGFRNTFNRAKTTATTNAVEKPSIFTPGIK